MRLGQCYEARTKRDFPLPENSVRGGRYHERRPHTPNDLLGISGRYEKLGIHVPKTVLPTSRQVRIRLPHKGLNDAIDEHPVFRNMHWYNWLDFEHILDAAEGA